MLRRMPMMITCGEFEDFVLAYFEGELSSQQRFVFELHLKVCRECRDYLAAYRRAVEVAKRVFDNEDELVPADVPEDLVTAILAARDA
jgi:predicted anti-sigma-YlaC factor YlaD